MPASAAGAATCLMARAAAAERAARDDDAMALYLAVLREDAEHRAALVALGRLSLARGKRAAARLLFARAGSLAALVTLGNMALEEEDFAAARGHYQAALARAPDCAAAHQGLARVFWQTGGEDAAVRHEALGFAAAPSGPRHYLGAEPGLDILYLAAARGGNVRLSAYIDAHRLASTVVYPEHADLTLPLPPHRLIVNAIADADFAGAALAQAEKLVAVSGAPVVNHPAKVAATGRAALAARCQGIPGIVAPNTALRTRAQIAALGGHELPILLRTPGHHTGRHFGMAADRTTLAALLDELPGEALFTIPYLNARGPDGMFRKYRVLFIDGALYPWHLAISADWKVHYFSAAMAASAPARAEEQNFLDNMPSVLGARAMAALEALGARLGLDYAGADFALNDAGDILLFEANAAMAMVPPPPGDLWDYRRPAANAAQAALRAMLARRAAAATKTT